MIFCAGKSESFEFAKPIGIGLVESAMRLTQYIIGNKPSFILFIGTTGSYGNFKPFDVIHTHKSSNIELSFLQNQSYTPIENFANSKKIYVSRGTTDSSPIVNSSNYITTDEKLSKQFLQKGIELENMELFSVISVANHFNIPSSALLVVTNYCNENAHNDFLKNHARAKELITLYVEKNLKL